MRRGLIAVVIATMAVTGFGAPSGAAEDPRVAAVVERGGGSVQYASLRKRSQGPRIKRHVLRLFTRSQSDHVVTAVRGGRSAVASYFGQNNGFDEWRIRRTASADANAVLRKLIRRIRQRGKVSFIAFSDDPVFPGGAIAHTCKLRGYNKLGGCRFRY